MIKTNISQSQARQVMHSNGDGYFFWRNDTSDCCAIRLFCFPYAGAGASCFKNWARLLPHSIGVYCAQLRGRETRIREAPSHSIMAIAEEAARSIRAYRDKPFALFGHSMGALICFELAQYLKRAGEREPQWLFVSGRRAPHIPYADPVSYNLPEAAFLWELEKLRGTPPELLKNSELLQLILPTLRADFEACQTYKCSSDTQELSCPITVFGGLADEISPEQLKGWRHYSTGRFQIHLLPGDHFYVRTEENRLTSLIADQLSPICYGHSGPITGDLRCEGI